MKVFLLLISLLCFGNYQFAQTKIDNAKIEKLCFKLHNTHRDTSHLRVISKDCKKATEYQIDYLFKNSLITHDNPNYEFERPSERYSKFNTDSIKIKSLQSKKGWDKTPKTDYAGEIITMSSGYIYKKDSLLEENIAKQIITNFVSSPGHYHIMKFSQYEVIKEFGYFSIRTKILKETNETVKVYFLCVAMFGYESYRNPEWIVK
jgi:hypothetical protein